MRVPHGWHWSWRDPFRLTCRCGLSWRACLLMQQLERDEIMRAWDRAADGLAAAQDWRDEERGRWSGGAGCR
jgi:hypothetical protein